MSKTTQLKDPVTKDKLYPVTTTDCIYLPNGISLNSYLNMIPYKDLSNVTYPENTAGSTTTGSGDRVIETYISSDKNTWYRKWASGWKECGQTLNFDGQVASNGTSTRTVTLPLNIENILFAVCNTNINTAGVADGSVFVNIGEYAVQNGSKTAKLYIRNTASSSSAKNIIMSYYCYGY